MEIRKRVEMVVLIELLECVGIQCCVHGISPSLAVLSGLLGIVAFSPAESQFNGRYRGTTLRVRHYPGRVGNWFSFQGCRRGEQHSLEILTDKKKQASGACFDQR